MGFSRYAIEKKQVSHDRGVTWEDVTPYETQRGRYMGSYRTLLDCQDLNCELEEDRYELVDTELPTEICGGDIPFGLAKVITFTEGIVICGVSPSAGGCKITTDSTSANIKYYYDTNQETHNISIGTTHSYGGENCAAYKEYYTLNLYGSYLSGICEFNCCSCCDTCTCFVIDEYMSFVGQSIKKIIKKHYKRDNCSSEWYIDEETPFEDMGWGERWIYMEDEISATTWQHQLASVDESGNTVWENVDIVRDVRDFSDVLPEGATLNYVKAPERYGDFGSKYYFNETVAWANNALNDNGYITTDNVHNDATRFIPMAYGSSLNLLDYGLGSNLKWNKDVAINNQLQLETNTLTISGGTTSVSGITQVNCRNLILGDGITTIERYSLRKLPNIESIRLPNTLVYIDRACFDSGLTINELVFPSSLNCFNAPDIVNIDSGAFATCNITNLVISGYPPMNETNGVAPLYRAFRNGTINTLWVNDDEYQYYTRQAEHPDSKLNNAYYSWYVYTLWGVINNIRPISERI